MMIMYIDWLVIIRFMSIMSAGSLHIECPSALALSHNADFFPVWCLINYLLYLSSAAVGIASTHSLNY